MTGHPSEIPLRVLIVDADDEATLTLAHTLEIEPVVLSVNVSHLPADHREVEAADVNTIFIDPLAVTSVWPSRGVRGAAIAVGATCSARRRAR